MRRVLWSAGVAVALTMIGAGQAHAQLPLNISVGPTFTNFSGDGIDADTKAGFFVAAGTAIQLGEMISLGPNLAYVQKGAEASNGNDLSLDYIEIPVFVNTTFPVGESASLTIGVGPQIAFNVSCDAAGFDCSDDPDLNGTEFGIVAGTNVTFPLSDGVGLALGGGGDFGLTDVFDDTDASNTAYYLLAGLSFAVGG